MCHHFTELCENQSSRLSHYVILLTNVNNQPCVHRKLERMYVCFARCNHVGYSFKFYMNMYDVDEDITTLAYVITIACPAVHVGNLDAA